MKYRVVNVINVMLKYATNNFAINIVYQIVRFIVKNKICNNRVTRCDSVFIW